MKNNEVLIKATVGTFSVTALLGEGAAQITDGFGGWSVVDRPRKVGMTIWKGRAPFQMSLPIMLDGWSKRESQESKIRQLIWMSLPAKGGGDPVPVKLYGALPFPSGGLWLLDKIAFGGDTIWSDSSTPVRLRQDVNLTFIQFVAPDQVELLDSNQGLRPKFKGPHTVKAGDTLKTLAQFYYGDYNLWQKIADANNLREPIIPKKVKTITIPQ